MHKFSYFQVLLIIDAPKIERVNNLLSFLYVSCSYMIMKVAFQGSLFLPLSLFWFKHFQLLDMLLERFYLVKKVAHNTVIAAGLCLFFYATNIRITCIIACVPVSLLVLEHSCAPKEAFLHGITSAVVIAIILCRVDKRVTTSYFQDLSWDILRCTLWPCYKDTFPRFRLECKTIHLFYWVNVAMIIAVTWKPMQNFFRKRKSLAPPPCLSLPLALSLKLPFPLLYSSQSNG